VRAEDIIVIRAETKGERNEGQHKMSQHTVLCLRNSSERYQLQTNSNSNCQFLHPAELLSRRLLTVPDCTLWSLTHSRLHVSAVAAILGTALTLTLLTVPDCTLWSPLHSRLHVSAVAAIWGNTNTNTNTKTTYCTGLYIMVTVTQSTASFGSASHMGTTLTLLTVPDCTLWSPIHSQSTACFGSGNHIGDSTNTNTTFVQSALCSKGYCTQSVHYFSQTAAQ